MSPPPIARLCVSALCALHSLVALADDGPHCRYVKQAELSILVIHNQPLISVKVNDQPEPFLADTGSVMTFINEGLADHMGLKFDQTGMMVRGAGGTAMIWTTDLNDFSIDQIHVGPVRLKVLAQHKVEDLPGGMVGANFLFLDDLEIAFSKSKLRMFKPEHCESNFLAYWDDNANVVNLEPLVLADPRPRFRVMLNGNPAMAIIDSGATVSLIDSSLAAQVGATLANPDESASQIRGIGRSGVKTFAVRFNSLSVGDETIQQAVVMTADLSSTRHEIQPYQVVLGADFPKTHRVLFAISQRKLYFSYLGGKPFQVF